MQSAVGRVVIEVRPGVEGDAGADAGWVDVGMGGGGGGGGRLVGEVCGTHAVANRRVERTAINSRDDIIRSSFSCQSNQFLPIGKAVKSNFARDDRFSRVQKVGKAIADDVLVDFLIAQLHDRNALSVVTAEITQLKHSAKSVVEKRLLQEREPGVARRYNNDQTYADSKWRLEHLERWVKDSQKRERSRHSA